MGIYRVNQQKGSLSPSLSLCFSNKTSRANPLTGRAAVSGERAEALPGPAVTCLPCACRQPFLLSQARGALPHTLSLKRVSGKHTPGSCFLPTRHPLKLSVPSEVSQTLHSHIPGNLSKAHWCSSNGLNCHMLLPKPGLTCRKSCEHSSLDLRQACDSMVTNKSQRQMAVQLLASSWERLLSCLQPLCKVT